MTEAGMYICQALGMSEEREEQQSELEREERRLERLRLVVVPHPDVWEPAEPPVREADPWEGPGGTGRYPLRGPEPDPQTAA
jgi:hypothetical protein